MSAILIAEDHDEIASFVDKGLRASGYRTTIVGDGRQAWALASTGAFDLLVLDVGLPDESGLSVLERLKRDPATRHIPVHMLSLHDRAQTALELGAVGYLMKPLAREQIAQAVHKLQAKLQQRLHRILVVDDHLEHRRVLAGLLEPLGFVIEQADRAIAPVVTRSPGTRPSSNASMTIASALSAANCCSPDQPSVVRTRMRWPRGNGASRRTASVSAASGSSTICGEPGRVCWT